MMQGVHASIAISRQRRVRHIFRRYLVLVDGGPAGHVSNGKTRILAVSTGAHRLRIVIDRYWSSPEHLVELSDGDVALFICTPRQSFTPGLIKMTRPKDYISLDLVSITPQMRNDI